MFLNCVEKGLKVHEKFLSGFHCLQKSWVPIKKTIFFVDLTKSSQSGQYLEGTVYNLVVHWLR